jgi:hypothetical protein
MLISQICASCTKRQSVFGLAGRKEVMLSFSEVQALRTLKQFVRRNDISPQYQTVCNVPGVL